MRKYISLLQSTDLFYGFSSAELDDLLSDPLCKFNEYPKGTMIYSQNEKCKSLDIVLIGVLSVQKIDSNGNILTISDFIAGDIVGGNLLFSPKNFYPMTVIAKSDLAILHIDKECILALCQGSQTFLVRFLQSISDKTLFLTDRIKSLTMKTIRQYIIEFLLGEYYLQNSATIKMPMSKKELAERFGIQRPSLSRELNKMRRDGLIIFDAHSITIRDVALLSSLRVHT